MGRTDRNSTVEDLIIALKDPRVLEAISAAVVHPLLVSIAELKKENEANAAKILKLQNELSSANNRIETLEQYTRRDNLLIEGLPVQSFAEAGSTGATEEPNKAVEDSLLKLFNEKLGVRVTDKDISIAHRLKKANSSTRPPTTIVKFTNRKVREAVYAARRNLKPSPGTDPALYPHIFINEDLSKSTAAVFQSARQAVKAKQIHRTWTSSCAVFVKVTPDPNCRPRKITTISDLQELLRIS